MRPVMRLNQASYGREMYFKMSADAEPVPVGYNFLAHHSSGQDGNVRVAIEGSRGDGPGAE